MDIETHTKEYAAWIDENLQDEVLLSLTSLDQTMGLPTGTADLMFDNIVRKSNCRVVERNGDIVRMRKLTDDDIPF